MKKKMIRIILRVLIFEMIYVVLLVFERTLLFSGVTAGIISSLIVEILKLLHWFPNGDSGESDDKSKKLLDFARQFLFVVGIMAVSTVVTDVIMKKMDALHVPTVSEGLEAEYEKEETGNTEADHMIASDDEILSERYSERESETAFREDGGAAEEDGIWKETVEDIVEFLENIVPNVIDEQEETLPPSVIADNRGESQYTDPAENQTITDYENVSENVQPSDLDIRKPTDPEETYPSDPETAQPSNPEEEQSSDSEGTRPSGPEEILPSDPGVTGPSVPVEIQPSDPDAAGPSDPGVTDPSGPEEILPSDPGIADPSGPEETLPSDPGIAGPSGPEETLPSDPGIADPSGPEEILPSDPGIAGPSGPEEIFPSDPGIAGPSGPEEIFPSDPGIAGPSGPEEIFPSDPGITGPSGPGDIQPDDGEEQPIQRNDYEVPAIEKKEGGTIHNTETEIMVSEDEADKIVDISGAARVSDRMRYAKDERSFSFIPPFSGDFFFEIISEKDCAEYEVTFSGADNGMGSSYSDRYVIVAEELLKVHMNAEEASLIHIRQPGGFGGYVLHIWYPEEPKDISAFTSYHDSLQFWGQEKVYWITPDYSGCFRIDVSGLAKSQDILISIYSPDGQKYTGDKSGLTIPDVKAGEKYKVVVTQYKGYGSYELQIGRQKETIDLTGYTGAKDCIQYQDQHNWYKVILDEAGTWFFQILEVKEKNLVIDLFLFDETGAQIGGSRYTGEGAKGLYVDAEKGERLMILVRGQEAEGSYLLDYGICPADQAQN